MIAPLVFRRFFAVPPVFLSGRLFLFFGPRNLHDADFGCDSYSSILSESLRCYSWRTVHDAAVALHSGFPGFCIDRLRLTGSVRAQPARNFPRGRETFSLDPAAAVFRQKHRDHVSDKATSVHKIPENEKIL
ncbi:hypothetical protein [Pseudomonas cannabina]|uniref:hypothetical protein n=1 Tax=Pseudomonas cannabina TaxID=86840 RepID=UPI0012E19234|nr:hypothetical protein [Pseudomonas cannabina]